MHPHQHAEQQPAAAAGVFLPAVSAASCSLCSSPARHPPLRRRRVHLRSGSLPRPRGELVLLGVWVKKEEKKERSRRKDAVGFSRPHRRAPLGVRLNTEDDGERGSILDADAPRAQHCTFKYIDYTVGAAKELHDQFAGLRRLQLHLCFTFRRWIRSRVYLACARRDFTCPLQKNTFSVLFCRLTMNPSLQSFAN